MMRRRGLKFLVALPLLWLHACAPVDDFDGSLKRLFLGDSCMVALCQGYFCDAGRWPRTPDELAYWARAKGYRFDPDRNGHLDFRDLGERLEIDWDQPDTRASLSGHRTELVERPKSWPTTQLSDCGRIGG